MFWRATCPRRTGIFTLGQIQEPSYSAFLSYSRTNEQDKEDNLEVERIVKETRVYSPGIKQKMTQERQWDPRESEKSPSWNPNKKKACLNESKRLAVLRLETLAPSDEMSLRAVITH